MGLPTIKGIEAKMIITKRIRTRVLFTENPAGDPVLFLHGDWSCASWWEETMVALPDGFWGIAPDQRGYGQADIREKVNARHGARDWSDDIAVLLDYLAIEKVHIVGCSLGGFIVWQFMVDYPEKLLSITQINPVSPFGYCGTKDIYGMPCYLDYAGSGGGLTNPELIKRVIEQDRSLESEFSPRASIRALFVPPFLPPREEILLSSVLATHVGEQDNPGDHQPSPNWPFVAPGIWGPYNAASPKYAVDVHEIYDGRITVPVLWIRSSHDQVISDQSTSDVGYLGKQGLIPDWPGEEVYPPQPMVSQTRAVLEKYKEGGGSYNEVVIQEVNHIPFIEKPDEFNAHFHSFLVSML